MTRIQLVIPCYNEASRLPVQTIEAFLRSQENVLLTMVNDGSTDETILILRDLEERWPGRVVVLDLEANRGKAEAVRQGMLKAMESEADYAGFWDADLATPLPVALNFSTLMDENPQIEMVLGSRVQLLGHRIQRKPMRHYLGRISATSVSLLLGLRVYDTQCGAKLFRVTPVTKGLFEAEFKSRWIFDVEIIARYVKACREGGRRADEGMYEQPLPEWRDVAGSKVKPTDFLSAGMDLVRIYRIYRPRG